MRALAAIALVATTATLAPLGARADIYQCRGEDGAVHYTNVRQPGLRCTVAVRESSRAPAPAAGAPGHVSRPAPSPRPANAEHLFEPFIAEAARTYQLPHAFIRAVVRVESNFNPTVVSEAGAIGLMQLMPRTARSMGVYDPFDPRQNILGGTRYLRILANKFNGDLVLTVAAYNAGEGAVIRHRGVPPYTETRRYVQRVLRHYYAYRSSGPTAR